MTKDEALKLALNELVWANRYCDIQTGVIEAVKEASAQPEHDDLTITDGRGCIDGISK